MKKNNITYLKKITISTALSACTLTAIAAPNLNAEDPSSGPLKTMNQTLSQTLNVINNALKAYAYSSYQPTPLIDQQDYYTTSQQRNEHQVSQLEQNTSAENDTTLQDVNALLKQFQKQAVPSTDDDTQFATDQKNDDKDKDKKSEPVLTPDQNLYMLTGMNAAGSSTIRGSDNLLSTSDSKDLSFTSDNPSFSYNTLMHNPLSDSYSYNTTESNNYVKLLTNSYNFNSAWFNNTAISALHDDLMNLATAGSYGAEYNIKDKNSKYRQFISQLQLNQSFLSYKASYRSSVAAYSMILGTLTNLQQERECGIDGCTSTPSPLALQHKIDTWRVQNQPWHKFIATASSTTLLREMVQIQAQQLSNQYQQHLDNEKIEALLALQNLQSLKQASAANISQSTQLKKTIDATYKQFSDSDSDSNSNSNSNNSSNNEDSDSSNKDNSSSGSKS